MAAPMNNKNHLTFNHEVIKDILEDAILATKNNLEIFNFPQLHRAVGLQTLRTLQYLANRHRANPEIMNLWGLLMAEMGKNQQIHIQSLSANN